jgi:hypothetical protein
MPQRAFERFEWNVRGPVRFAGQEAVDQREIDIVEVDADP